jgi:uncharacterized protein YbjQ (UPF0145 family)
VEEKFCKDCGAKCYSPEGRCTDCMLARPSKKKPKAQEANENIKLTTSFGFTNYEITDEVGIVTSECVCGMNIVRDFFVSMADFFGGRSVETQRALNDARNTCLKELKKEAYDMGADGVMGIDLDYSDFGHKSMLFLVASGTAVKLRPKSEN